MSNEGCDNGSVRFQYYAVALIDVLGQRDALKSITNLPQSEEQKAHFIEGVKDTLGRMLAVREWTGGFFESFQNAPPPDVLAKLPPKEQELFHGFRRCTLRIQQFSDTVVAYSALANERENLSFRGLYSILAACASLMLIALSEGTPIRGAVELGVGTELDGREIYGHVLAEAHRLEQTVAQYPRVVIGNELLDALHYFRDRPMLGLAAEVTRELAGLCESLLAVDQDGAVFVDYLGESFRESVGADNYVDLLPKALRIITERHGRFMDESDHKLALRYACLRQYWEARIEEWGEESKRSEAGP